MLNRGVRGRLIFLALLLASVRQSAACDVYFITELGGAWRAHADGSGVQLVVPDVWADVGIDAESGTLFSMHGAGVVRTTLSGDDLQPVFTYTWDEKTTGFGSYSIAVDSVHGRIYWTYTKFQATVDALFVASVEFDGSDYRYRLNEVTAAGVAVDPENEVLYFNDARWIRCSNLDGSSPELCFYDDEAYPRRLDFDQDRRTLYWTGRTVFAESAIRRSTLEGAEFIVRNLVVAEDVAVDSVHGKIYWTDSGTDKIQRANLDGSEIEDVLTGLERLRGLTVDARSVDLRLSRDEIMWDALSGTLHYDVVQGDLATLLATGGDFETAVTACLAEDSQATNVPATEEPGPGQATWYLARARFVGDVDSAYGACYLTQLGSREAIGLSPDSCL